jgi:hypothetical protein
MGSSSIHHLHADVQLDEIERYGRRTQPSTTQTA